MFFTWEPAELPSSSTRSRGSTWRPRSARSARGVQASVLRVLAEHAGVLYAGTAEDRQGREGELFLVEDDTEPGGDRLERRIPFDAETGMPLYHEVVAVGSDVDQLDGAELPRVNHYAAIVESAWVPDVGEHP